MNKEVENAIVLWIFSSIRAKCKFDDDIFVLDYCLIGTGCNRIPLAARAALGSLAVAPTALPDPASAG